jgi:L-amino acid N-acyltransferase YncA
LGHDVGGADLTPSILLHESLGFRAAGHLHEVGHNFDRWLDLVTMELRV